MARGVWLLPDSQNVTVSSVYSQCGAGISMTTTVLREPWEEPQGEISPEFQDLEERACRAMQGKGNMLVPLGKLYN